ncbi:hypothetical protein PRIPAC_75452 [Pristionchus pacificus]|uniref:Uncharacterized protein n=1 Tax=Pristionchus pacificus TaxID=54126 RepID=A0A2A6C7H1_PRIPA|nr:hypothetical protein PRIPAC_75452 [Pristionchus pacificus]|eukprot:PDM74124.1 hypothetical protein PRIPAC_41480 [Pristionchus pacificus]
MELVHNSYGVVLGLGSARNPDRAGTRGVGHGGSREELGIVVVVIVVILSGYVNGMRAKNGSDGMSGDNDWWVKEMGGRLRPQTDTKDSRATHCKAY